ERLLVEDLLVVLLGLDGTYVSVARLARPPVLYVADGIVAELGDMCASLLPLSANVQIVRREAELLLELERGVVAHALGAVLNSLLDEYLESIVQLDEASHVENGRTLTMERLWFAVQPSMRHMELLAELVDECAVL